MNPLWSELSDFIPTSLPIQVNSVIISKAMDYGFSHNCWVLAFIVGTKPCFNKVYGAIQACKRRNIPFFVINANQHYDQSLTYMLNEFEYMNHIGINLQIRGDLIQKSGELVFKIARSARWLKDLWPSVTVVPVVNGDTILCPITSMAWMFSRTEKAIHLEAGLRSMSPNSFRNLDQNVQLMKFLESQWFEDWHILRSEPFPEQWDTFATSAACDFHFVPVNLNKQHLVREGYPEERIFVIGGVVQDALEVAMKKNTKKYLTDYPLLSEHQWLRFDIHRKENMTTERFMILFDLLENLIRSGVYVQFVLMNSTKQAISICALENRLNKLRKLPNLLVTDVWPAYADIVEFYQSENFLAAVTDSGGVQEDMHILGKPCITLRYSTDRPETVMNCCGNVLVPPINSDFMTRIILELIQNKTLLNKLSHHGLVYGENVGEKFIDNLSPFIFTNHQAFSWSNDFLGIKNFPNS